MMNTDERLWGSGEVFAIYEISRMRRPAVNALVSGRPSGRRCELVQRRMSSGASSADQNFSNLFRQFSHGKRFMDEAGVSVLRYFCPEFTGAISA